MDVVDPPKQPSSTSPTPAATARNAQKSVEATLALAIDATSSHRHLLPGLATLFFANGGVGMGMLSIPLAATEKDKIDLTDDIASSAALLEGGGHPSLPSVDAVSNAAVRSVDDVPPFVTLAKLDSAPQLKIDNPSPVDVTIDDAQSSTKSLQRRLVVRGGMRGYRMSRATHAATKGCYYYEAIILDPNDVKRGVKRPLDENNTDGNNTTSTVTKQRNGHLRIGWSTRLGDLQAPVGYDKHSYAVRDTMGSKVHNSRREDKWGGEDFDPGDVIGFAICLAGNSVTSAADAITCDVTGGNAAATETAPKTNHIRFYKNGELMGNCVAYDDITPEAYFPAISCYLEGSAQMNFGPHFVYPPKGLPDGTTLEPVSALCKPPPLPEDAVEMVTSGKEGKNVFIPKRSDEGIVAAFKELVRAEASVRRDAYLHHMRLHTNEIKAFRKERGLATSDLEDR
jgi:Set1/Ash2 histone methyltransferase complex subunit ASH2